MKTWIFCVVVFVAGVVVDLVVAGPAVTGLSSSLAGAGAAEWGPFVLATVGAILLQVVGHLLRSVKHASLLNNVRPIRQSQVFRGQMIGFAINALLPFRVGEIVRAHYIGRSVQISRSAVFATILLERAIDLAVIAVIGTATAIVAFATGVPAVGFVPVLVTGLGLALLTTVILAMAKRQPTWLLRAVAVVTAVFNDRLRNRARQVVWSFSHALDYALPDRRAVLRYGVLSAAMWLAYLGSIVVLVAVLVPHDAKAPGVLVVAPYLGVTTTTGPAFFGPFIAHFGATAAGLLSDPMLIATVGLAIWAVLVLPSIVIGGICLLRVRLVDHVDGPATTIDALRNKLFRDLRTSDEFAHFLASHFEGHALSRVVSRLEATGRFTVLRTLKGGSNALALLVFENGRTVVKKITLPEHASKLHSQYEWLRERADAPQVVGALADDSGPDYFSIDLEFRDAYRPFFQTLHAGSHEAGWRVLEGVLDFVDGRIYRPQPVDDREGVLESYLTTKAVGKIADAARTSPQLAELLTSEALVVNGVRVDNFPVVIDRLRSNEQAMTELAEFAQSPIHGDLTVDNILVDPATGEYMLIDSNDENLISDPVVDYAKLLQSVHSGYEFLLDQTNVVVVGDNIVFEERKSAHYQYLSERLFARLQERLSPAQFRSLLFHEAMHYCRMLTYRVNIDPATAPMYYGIAVRLFNEFLGQYESAGVAPANAVELLGAR